MGGHEEGRPQLAKVLSSIGPAPRSPLALLAVGRKGDIREGCLGELHAAFSKSPPSGRGLPLVAREDLQHDARMLRVELDRRGASQA